MMDKRKNPRSFGCPPPSPPCWGGMIVPLFLDVDDAEDDADGGENTIEGGGRGTGSSWMVVVVVLLLGLPFVFVTTRRRIPASKSSDVSLMESPSNWTEVITTTDPLDSYESVRPGGDVIIVVVAVVVAIADFGVFVLNILERDDEDSGDATLSGDSGDTTLVVVVVVVVFVGVVITVVVAAGGAISKSFFFILGDVNRGGNDGCSKESSSSSNSR